MYSCVLKISHFLPARPKHPGTIISMVTLADRNEIEYRDSMNSLVTFLAERREYISLDSRANLTKTMAHEWGKAMKDLTRMVLLLL